MEEPQQHPRPRHPAHSWRALLRAALAAALTLTALFGAAVPSQAVYKGTPTAYSWAVRITAGSETCTGELITTYAVLTAGHCFAGTPPKSATATFHYGVKGHQYDAAIDVKHIYLHPQYGYPRSYDNDLAVVYLVKAVHETPLPLATADPPLNASVTVAGYGCTVIPPLNHSCPGKLSGTLLRMTSKIIYSTICPHADGPWALCGYSSQSTASAGDSGGPVLRVESGTLKLVGVVSQYEPGSKYEDIFVSVPYEAKWIKDAADI